MLVAELVPAAFSQRRLLGEGVELYHNASACEDVAVALQHDTPRNKIQNQRANENGGEVGKGTAPSKLSTSVRDVFTLKHIILELKVSSEARTGSYGTEKTSTKIGKEKNKTCTDTPCT